MKNLKLLAIIGVFVTICLFSCQPDEICKNCRAVTTDANGNIISETAPIEYCEDELEAKENAEPIVVGDETTKYVCEDF